jgi:hypothetical protein
MKKWFVIFAVTLAFGVVACDSGDDDGNKEDNGKKEENAKDMCGGLCVSGQYCWNGICVDGCLSDGDCAANQYCLEDDFFDQGKCVPKQAQGCSSDNDCDGQQICQKGACVTPVAEEDQPAGGCEWKSDMTDGCTETEVCFQEMDDEGNDLPGECYNMPACGEDLSCPTEVEGAVCNVKEDGKKIIPSKSKICLMGLCLDESDCPSAMECFKMYSDIGACIPEGMMGGGCEADEDCGEGEVCETFTGTCMPDMGF